MYKKISVIIVLVICLLMMTIGGSYAVYVGNTGTSSGSVTARQFNTDVQFCGDISMDVWLGETNYWYFSVENVNKVGKVSKHDLNYDILFNLYAEEGVEPVGGLTVSVEEYRGSTDGNMKVKDWCNDNNWIGITNVLGSNTITTWGSFNSGGMEFSKASVHRFSYYRIVYSLLDDDKGHNGEDNGYDNNSDLDSINSLLHNKSKLDIAVRLF